MGREFLGLITPVGGIYIPLVALRGIVPVMKRPLRASYGKWRKTRKDGPDLGRVVARPPSGKRGSWQAAWPSAQHISCTGQPSTRHQKVVPDTHHVGHGWEMPHLGPGPAWHTGDSCHLC